MYGCGHRGVNNKNLWENLVDDVISMLRPDVLYLAVSQNAAGLQETFMNSRPNVLVISAGGFGHVPMPLIKGEREFREANYTEFDTDVGFNGRLSGPRENILRDMERACSGVHLQFKEHGINPDWVNQMLVRN